MTGNISILSNFRHFNGGYVVFGTDSKEGSITGQGTVSNERMSIERVNYVKELDINLMSVSQVCDQKHWMLFTDKECFVLSPCLNKPPLEKILLTAQRKDNLYVLNMNEFTPFGSVSCSLFSWVYFLRTKDETAEILKSYILRVENQSNQKVKVIRINRTLIESARSTLADSKLPLTFWAEAVGTACYMRNRVLIVKPLNKTNYELGFKRVPYIGFLKPFECLCTILISHGVLPKLGVKSEEGYFVGYSSQSKAYRVFNSRTRSVEESANVECREHITCE
ncbi:hypothetical protein L1987_53007 [Smallanthus sonchifolius]|uniref:Uncharacterized protein n=1 Tax=Smallanthus sonchifolius TaxID=185202 RepID=A0ACB9EUP4_9ASTR|nr:hypothetical protein L1987_53007 [Smallanthus sonchifolius]